MYNNQKQIDEIKEKIKSICPELEIGSFGLDGNKNVVSVSVMIPIKGNSEIIKKLEGIGFKKDYRKKSVDPWYASNRYRGYKMYQIMSMDLRG